MGHVWQRLGERMARISTRTRAVWKIFRALERAANSAGIGTATAFQVPKMLRYFAHLPTGRLVLWCYLIWYLCLVSRYFDPSPVLWGSSLGMSGIIGLALLLSTSGNGTGPDGWTKFRLFLMPFCVSSYAALIKGKGFILIFPPEWGGNLTGLSCILVFLSAQRILKAGGNLSARSNGAPAREGQLP